MFISLANSYFLSHLKFVYFNENRFHANFNFLELKVTSKSCHIILHIVECILMLL